MKIKDSLVFPFVMWMKIGGHGLSERHQHLVMKKGGKIATIHPSKDGCSEINGYCAERYNVFLAQWLNKGVSFIDELKLKGDLEIEKLRRYSYLELLK